MQEKVLYDDATIGDQQIGNNDIVYMVHAISGASKRLFLLFCSRPHVHACVRWSEGVWESIDILGAAKDDD